VVVSDLGTVRDEVVMPALAAGIEATDLADALGRTAESVLPLVTRNLAEDYRHIVLNLLDTDALARGVEGGREIDLAVGFGDAAMLIASDPVRLAEVLLDVVDDRTILAEAPRKAGLAHGPVLVRQGDYYGATPNLAARLTDHARPWSLLAAEDLDEALAEHFELTETPGTTLRGVGEHQPWRIRPGAATAAT
jgi:class 3 adenylate cyclase